jgi:peroxiredoxin (alkyl hydroperoxide reductase subunit C)
LGAELITVSKDTEYVHLAWHQHEHGLSMVKYPMGSDATGELSRMFGVYDFESGLALRGTFIINPDGKLLSQEVNYFNVGRNIDELMRKFKAYLHVSKHPVKACPSKWKDEGDVTLEPSAKLVGNVYSKEGTLVG